MAKRVMLIYQDCPTCGNRKEWGELQLKIAEDADIEVEKVPFVSPKAKGLAMKAVKAGIPSYPFFTDGNKFSKNVEVFAKKAQKRSKK